MHDTLSTTTRLVAPRKVAEKTDPLTLLPSSSTTILVPSFLLIRFAAAMHACLGIIHPNPL